jgi:hypothetical protein
LLSQEPKGQLITKSALGHKENTPVTNRIWKRIEKRW